MWCVGAGAIGGNVASRLVRAGMAPLVVDADPEHVALLRDPGLAVEGSDGETITPLDAITPASVADRSGGCDLLLLAVRWQATEAALRPLLERVAPDGDVVSLQNGLSCEKAAALAGVSRTIACAVGFGATYVAAGRVRLDAEGPLTMGRLGVSEDAADGAGVEDDRGLARACSVLGDAFRVRIAADVRSDLWSKMLTNSVTVLGAVGGMLLGEVLAPERRPLVRAVLAEGASVAAASGITARSVFGAPTALVVDRSPGWEAAIDAACDKAAARFGAVRSVTWRDIELGRPTEVGAVTGEIVSRGRRLGVATPVNGEILGLLRSIEAGGLSPDAAHLTALMKGRR